MTRAVHRGGAICLELALGLVICGALHAASAPPEHYQGPDANSARAKSTMQRGNPWIAHQMQDPSFVTRHHISYDRVDLSQVTRPNQIGIDIEPTSSERFANFGELNWRRHPSGHYAAVIAYTAEQAMALRIALNLADFPEKLTVKFISADPNKPYPAASLDYAKASEYLDRGVSVHWSPIHSGDTLHIELNYPDTAEAGFAAKRIELPGIAYIFADGPWGRKTRKKAGAATKTAVPKYSVPIDCRDNRDGRNGRVIDVSCGTPGLSNALRDNFSRATGLLEYREDNGGVFICTGHLINDKDPSTFRPYMLTAAHCVDSQTEAATVDVYWDYRPDSCGGDVDIFNSRPIRGATLRRTNIVQDWSLIELDSPPPGSRYFLGWNNDPPRLGETLYHIGHSGGNPQSYARGTIHSIETRRIGIEWRDGATTGGSSGSVFVQSVNNALYARSGGLSSGSFDFLCPRGDGIVEEYGYSDYVAPFSLVYPQIRQYIDNPAFPDRIVEQVSASPSNPLPEAIISISATVRNIGNTRANPTTLRYYLSNNFTIGTSDAQLCTDYVDLTPTGGLSSVSEDCILPLSAAAGRDYWIGACVDAVRYELNTRNNCSNGKQITVRHPPPSTARITVPNAGAREDRSATFTVSLDHPVPPAPAGFTADLRYALSGNAALSRDYNLSATGAALDTTLHTLIFRAGEQSAAVTLAPVNDNVVEANEMARLNFSASGDLSIFGTNPVSITIYDDDAPAILSLNAAPSPVLAGRNVQLSLTLDKPLSESLTVTIAVAGNSIDAISPASASDYTLSDSTAVIPAGHTVLNNAATIRTFSDAVDFEAFTVRIDATSLPTLPASSIESTGQQTAADVIISEDGDLVLERFDAAPLLVPETGATGTFTVRLAGPPSAGSTVTAVYQLPETWQGRSTAIPGTNYEDIRSAGSMETAGIRGTGEFIIPAESVAASLSISIMDDDIVEPNKPIVVAITSLRRGNITLPVSGGHNTAVMRIKDNDGILVRVRVFLQGPLTQ